MNPAIWGTALAADFGLVLGAYVHAYRRGREAGRREQRQIINRAMDKLRREAEEASTALDYLYEQASEEVERQLGRES